MTEPIKISDMIHMDRLATLEPVLARLPVDQHIIDEVFALLGESPEALRGLLFGLSLVDSATHSSIVAVLQGKLGILKVYLMRDPRGQAAWRILEPSADGVSDLTL